MEILNENEATCYAIVEEILKTGRDPSRSYFIQLNGKDPSPEFMKKIIARQGPFIPASKFQYDLKHNTKVSIFLSEFSNGIVAVSFSFWSGYETAYGWTGFFKFEKGHWRKMGHGSAWMT